VNKKKGKEIKFEQMSGDTNVIWTKHGTNATVIDPYKKKSIYVDQSEITTAEDGLFVKRIFSPGDLISYYSGQKTFIQNIVRTNVTCEDAWNIEICQFV
jgi:hypothetical protein